MSASPNKNEKRFRLEFSGTSAFFLTLICLLLLAWIFFLGVLAGRSYFSEGLNALLGGIFSSEKGKAGYEDKGESPSSFTKKVDNEPSFEFYKGLSGEAEKKDIPAAKKSETGSSAERPVKPDLSGQAYSVQVAALSSESHALKMVNRLVGKGYEAFFYKTMIRGKIYFRVMCGKFKNRKEADDFQKLLTRRENIKKTFVTRVEK